MKTVAIVVFPGVQALDVAGPLDVFAEANGFLPEGIGYEVVVVGTEAGPFRASNGMRIVPDRTLETAEGPFDMVFVAGGPLLPDAVPSAALSGWLRRESERARCFGSICTGAFALGHAGLLDGRHATTHWQNAEALARRFPDARIERDRIFLREGRLVTSAGVTAGIDLALALVNEDHGAEVALAVAKRLVVVAQRQGGQSQFSPLLNLVADDASPIAKVQDFVLCNIGKSISVKQLASVAGMSERNFARLFVETAKVTPHQFIELARVDVARNLLEAGDKPLKTIARDCGFGSPDRMRIVFMRRLGLTPVQYRASFSHGAEAG